MRSWKLFQMVKYLSWSLVVTHVIHIIILHNQHSVHSDTRHDGECGDSVNTCDNTWLIITIRYWHNVLSLFVLTAGVVWGVSRVKVLKEAVWPRVSTETAEHCLGQCREEMCRHCKSCYSLDTLPASLHSEMFMFICCMLLVGCEETWRWHHSRPCSKVQCLFIQCQSQCHSLC